MDGFRVQGLGLPGIRVQGAEWQGVKERKENGHHYLTGDWGLGCRSLGCRDYALSGFGLPNADAHRTLQEPKLSTSIPKTQVHMVVSQNRGTTI